MQSFFPRKDELKIETVEIRIKCHFIYHWISFNHWQGTFATKFAWLSNEYTVWIGFSIKYKFTVYTKFDSYLSNFFSYQRYHNPYVIFMFWNIRVFQIDIFYDSENKIPFEFLYRQLSGIDWDIDTGSRHNAVYIFIWSDYSFCDKVTSTGNSY